MLGYLAGVGEKKGLEDRGIARSKRIAKSREKIKLTKNLQRQSLWSFKKIGEFFRKL